MPEKDLHGFLIFGKMCKITSKKLEKCEKNKKKIDLFFPNKIPNFANVEVLLN